MREGERVIYEVNLRVDSDVSVEFDAWLTPHVEEMLGFDGFQNVSRWVQLDPPESPVPSNWWVLQYEVASMRALNAYLEGPAAAMRADGIARFKGRFEATRRILGSAESTQR